MNIFDTTAARLFWGYMNSSCYSVGVDAWWMDATEPECNLLTGQATSYGVIDLYSNALALAHAKNIYERQRSVSNAKRVVNLTRSFYGGQQRFGTIYWNGDLSGSDMTNVSTTVSGGLNSCMGGNPYWCSDIGGFQNGPTDEILTRWFQAGTFFPIFRIHGSRATEIYNMNTSPRQICTAFSRLRYRLMPYIYALAWKVTNEGYTMTRALPFDFPSDANVTNIANQYMFGSALLINPVVTTGATNRNVYLPAGTWYDFWTGLANANTAGRNVSASAPLAIIPIYARAGAILPMGPRIQYANQKQADTIELRVYPGADGNFTLYEDEGDNYNYENGSYSTIPIAYSNTTGKVTIGARTGSFTGMLTNRVFNIVFVSSGHGIGDTVTTNPDCIVKYNGAAITACPVTGTCEECLRQNFIKDEPFTVKTADEKIAFPPSYAGAIKNVAVYDLFGRLVQKASFKKQSISLRKDFGLSNGSYIVKVKLMR
jgi:alpha-D-xyloside xylohydrolase